MLRLTINGRVGVRLKKFVSVVVGLGVSAAALSATAGAAEVSEGQALAAECARVSPSSENTYEAFRETLGFDPKVPAEAERAVAEYGIPLTAAERAIFDEVAAITEIASASEVRAAASRAFPESYIGIAWEAATGWIVYHADDAPSRLGDRIASDLGLKPSNLRTVAVAGGVPAQQQIENQKYLISILSELAEHGAPATTMSDRCGLLDVQVLLDADTAAVEKLLLAGIPSGSFALRLIDESDLTTEVSTRNVAGANYLGGQKLEITGNGGDCTTGLGLFKDTPGGREWWGVTAAHCLPDQPGYTEDTFGVTTAQWRVGSADIGVTNGGTTNYFWYGGPMDIVVTQIDRRPLDKHWIEDGTVDIFTNMTWWQWHTNLDHNHDVTGAVYCSSGQKSDVLRCGNLNNRNHSFSVSAIKSGIGVAADFHSIRRVTFVGENVEEGDSGSGVWHVQNLANEVHNFAGILGFRDATSWSYTHSSYILTTFGLTSIVECDWFGNC